MKKGTRVTLQSAARRQVEVEIPELDAAFILREMSGTERDKFEAGAFVETDGKRSVNVVYLRARLVALCLVGEDGDRLYADDEVSQLSDAVPASILQKLFEAAQKLNGLDAAATEAALKNSGGGAPVASPSD